MRQLCVLVGLDLDHHSGAGGLLLEALDDLDDDREGQGRPEPDDLVPGLELGQEEDVVDQLSDLVDFALCLLDELDHVGAGQRARSRAGRARARGVCAARGRPPR